MSTRGTAGMAPPVVGGIENMTTNIGVVFDIYSSPVVTITVNVVVVCLCRRNVTTLDIFLYALFQIVSDGVVLYQSALRVFL
ncbi:hypothetical protein ES703_105807 [subsurface metagenome]